MQAFSSKAQTLKQLSGSLQQAKILPLHIFTVGEFAVAPDQVLLALKNRFSDAALIVRSSCKAEDGVRQSLAGHFLSVPNVSVNHGQGLRAAIERVIASYKSEDPENEVLVQPMLTRIVCAGVAFTADLDTLAPYTVINYDTTGMSDGVTAGVTVCTHTYVRFQQAPVDSPCPHAFLEKILAVCSECGVVFGCAHLDVEFAIDDQNDLYVFQVRPLTTNGISLPDNVKLADSLAKVYAKIKKLSQPHPGLLGDRAFYGVMPDWNPAEMIGIRPRRLAMSLYKELITDAIWAYQRDNYGYRNLRSHPLLVSFLGVPFIDVRVSFNSFVPKDLDEGIATKLIHAYLSKLEQHPQHHDKVEFEIVHSCYYFGIGERLKALGEYGMSAAQQEAIAQSLLKLTNAIVAPQGHFANDKEKIRALSGRYEAVMGSGLSTIDRIYWLCEDCKRHGTLPFAGIARAAFVAMQLLRSLVETRLISAEDFQAFLGSINTVARQLARDLVGFRAGTVSEQTLLKTYGHLRPGTYDILSPRYDEQPELYFSAITSETAIKHFSFGRDQLRGIDMALAETQLNLSAGDLMAFIRDAIEAREWAKFAFTRSVSEVLRLLKAFGARFGIGCEDMSFLDIREVLSLYATLDHRDVPDIFWSDINKNREFYRLTQCVRLPLLIVDPLDVYAHHQHEGEPNFVTQGRVVAAVTLEAGLYRESLVGRIVLISAADPGYDFLFGKGIAGLITEFGGGNSHMAIRCAELGLPAVIGAGPALFGKWKKAARIEIDGAAKQVRVLS